MTVYIGYFYANRTQITQAYCVNISKPEANCRGCCYLVKKLNAIQSQQSDESPNSIPVQFESRFEWSSMGVIHHHFFQNQGAEIFMPKLSYKYSTAHDFIEVPPPRC